MCVEINFSNMFLNDLVPDTSRSFQDLGFEFLSSVIAHYLKYFSAVHDKN